MSHQRLEDEDDDGHEDDPKRGAIFNQTSPGRVRPPRPDRPETLPIGSNTISPAWQPAILGTLPWCIVNSASQYSIGSLAELG